MFSIVLQIWWYRSSGTNGCKIPGSRSPFLSVLKNRRNPTKQLCAKLQPDRPCFSYELEHIYKYLYGKVLRNSIPIFMENDAASCCLAFHITPTSMIWTNYLIKHSTKRLKAPSKLPFVTTKQLTFIGNFRLWKAMRIGIWDWEPTRMYVTRWYSMCRGYGYDYVRNATKKHQLCRLDNEYK